MPIPSEMYYYLYIRKKRKEKQGRRIKERQGRGREIKGGHGGASYPLEVIGVDEAFTVL